MVKLKWYASLNLNKKKKNSSLDQFPRISITIKSDRLQTAFVYEKLFKDRGSLSPSSDTCSNISWYYVVKLELSISLHSKTCLQVTDITHSLCVCTSYEQKAYLVNVCTTIYIRFGYFFFFICGGTNTTYHIKSLGKWLEIINLEEKKNKWPCVLPKVYPIHFTKFLCI